MLSRYRKDGKRTTFWFVLETQSHYVALTVLIFVMWTRPLMRSTCFCLPSGGIKGVIHHAGHETTLISFCSQESIEPLKYLSITLENCDINYTSYSAFFFQSPIHPFMRLFLCTSFNPLIHVPIHPFISIIQRAGAIMSKKSYFQMEGELERISEELGEGKP